MAFCLVDPKAARCWKKVGEVFFQKKRFYPLLETMKNPSIRITTRHLITFFLYVSTTYVLSVW